MQTNAGAPDPSAAEPDWAQVRSLFEELLSCDTVERDRRLAERAGHAPALLARVRELFAQHDAAGSFLATPLQSDAVAQEPRDRGGDDAMHGQSVGPFRIVATIARGGMGVVYEAEQNHPRRRVAIKMLRTALPSPEMLRRFLDEAEILARLRHPHVAQVFEVGTHRPGGAPASDPVPYFAMELVEGARTILEHANASSLTWRRRVELLLQVCDAIHHAHQRGVIHRDVKPQNVLVDADGRCKVIDFGVARRIRGDAASAAWTLPGVLLGTPAYMSPEQRRGDGDAIDVRTDVYALGVLLHELVTGALPFAVAGRSITEALQWLEHAEPTRPSAVVASLPRELDWIVARGLERDPDRRYGTVADLGADLRRLLADLPVQAGPPSTTYRMAKFVRRHRVAVAAGFAFVVVLVAALVTSVGFWNRAAKDRDRARSEERVSAAVARFVETMFGSAHPDAKGRDVRLADVVRDTARGLHADRAMDPLVRASLQRTLGRTLQALGLDQEALPLIAAAFPTMQELLGEDDPRAIESESLLADTLLNLGRVDEAERHAIAADERARRTDRDAQVLAKTAAGLAHVRMTQGRYDEADLELARAEAAADTARTTTPGARAAHTAHLVGDALADVQAGSIAMTRSDLARTRGNLAEAKAQADRAVELSSRAFGPTHPRAVQAAAQRALAAADLGDFEGAERDLREVVELLTRSLGPEHPSTRNAIGSLGTLLHRRGKHDESAALHEAVLAAQRSELGPDHPSVLTAWNNLAMVRIDQRRVAEAVTMLEEILAIARRTFGPDDVRLVAAIGNLAQAQRRAGRNEAAEALYREAIAKEESRTTVGPSLLRLRYNFAVLLQARGAHDEAETTLRGVLDGRRRVLGPDHPDTLNAQETLAANLMRRGDLADAEELARDLLTRRRAAAHTDHWITASQALGMILERRNDLDGAREHFSAAIDGAEATASTRGLRAVRVRQTFADFLIRRKEHDAAKALLVRSVEAFDADPTLGEDDRARTRARVLERLIGIADVQSDAAAAANWRARLGDDKR